MKNILLATSLLLLSGCSWWNCVPEIQYKYVEVPVYKALPPPHIDKPVLDLDNPEKREYLLSGTKEEQSKKISEALRNDIVRLKEYNKKLEGVVDTYREVAEQDGDNTN